MRKNERLILRIRMPNEGWAYGFLHMDNTLCIRFF